MKKAGYLQSGSAILAVAASMAAGAAMAQDASPQQNDNGIAEIIVTAQKRAQKLNDVGITIVAATNEQLQSAGVTEVSQLTKVAPGFSVGNTYAGYQVFSLRGINFNATQFSAPPAVSTYVDEAILPYSAMTGGLLLDVDHVEVLKGPQGTLFGQNATGGSINIVAAKPTGTPKAGFDLEVNHFGQVIGSGFVSGPLSDTLRARLAASTTQFGAWQKGYYLNNRKNGDQNKGAARLLLDWTPTDRLTVSVNLNANYDHGEQQQAQFGRFSPQQPTYLPGLATYPVPTDNRDADISDGIDTHARNRLYQGVLRMDYEIADTLTLTSLTNYLDFDSNVGRDGDGTALGVINYRTRGKDKTFAQEVRLSGDAFESNLKYILGVNYQKDKIVDGLDNIFPGYSAIPPGTFFTVDNDIRARSLGFFGNLEYQFTPELSITGGARYTETKQSIDGCFTGNAQAAGLLGFISDLFRSGAGLPSGAGAFVPGGCLSINDAFPNVANPNGPGLIPDYLPVAADYTQKEHNVSWRGGVNYKATPDTLIYGLVSRGYKAGLFPNMIALFAAQINPVKQEQLTSYEIGAKLGLFDRAVQLNVSAFYYDYRDKQFFTYRPQPVVGSNAFLLNVPKSKVKGFDIDLTVAPVPGLTLRGAVTYVDTKVGSFQTFDFLGNALDATGTEFNYSSPWSGSFDGQYSFAIGESRSLYLGGGGSFASRTFSNLGETEASRIPGYVIFDARVGVESDNGWRVGLFARNLTNKYYFTAVFPSGDTDGRFSGMPRTFGATASFRW